MAEARRASLVSGSLLAVGAVLLTGTMAFSWWSGDRMVRKYAPLIDAVMNVKYQATLAHLWFEEWVSGDLSVEIEQIWRHLDRADAYALAMLEGGERDGRSVLPIDDPTLRAEIEEVRIGLHAFRSVAEQRAAVRGESSIGSNVDQRFDAIFSRFLRRAERAHSGLQTAMAERLRLFRGLQLSLILATIAAAFAMGIFLTRFIRQRDRAHEARRQIELRMQQAQKLESLGVMAGGIAHDFNNILQAILGNLGLALEDSAAGSALRECLDEAEVASLRGADLCRQMLAYSGRGQFVIEPVDLSALVEGMESLLRAGITNAALLELDLARDLPAVEADATQLRQVVMNLVSNASEALDAEGGRVRVTTRPGRRDEPGRTRSSLDGEFRAGRSVCLEVSDTGCGMTSETLEKIFEPFFTTKFTGRGLGLAAVQGIVRAHKGVLEVESEPRRGSRFRLLLPSAGRPIVRPEPAPSGGRAADGGGLVLVVDDEVAILRVARRMVEQQGFAAMTARGGREAIQRFREHAADVRCVILDLTMPGMGGRETFRALRAIRPDVPVVLSSGFSAEEAHRLFDGNGLAGFIHKPYRAVELAGAIRNACQAEAVSEDGGAN